MRHAGVHDSSDERPTALVLGIETSCDESAAAVVRADRSSWLAANDDQTRVEHGISAQKHHPRRDEILSNIVASQHELHAGFGGVVPEIASRAHAERLLPVIRKAVTDAGVTLSQIDAVAVGDRPGLIGSLLVGVATAKSIAWSLGVPIVGVDHVEAHVYSGLMSADETLLRDAWPALGLVVSGGHTAIYRCSGPASIVRIGATIDDAIGEAYDKVAAMLGLAYPGGPEVDKLARNGNPNAYDFPVARLDKDSLDFSYSGLKTSVLYTLQRIAKDNDSATTATSDLAMSAGGLRLAADLDDQTKADICASFQRAAVRAVLLKLQRAIDAEPRPGVRTLLVGGGVSANSALRAALVELGITTGIRVVLPQMSLCVDNAAMIAGLGGRVLADQHWTGDIADVTASPSTRRAGEAKYQARGLPR